jgi:UDP-N-acetylmuramoyl-L-alanyl-D-glutamate--2,6-diaminopimelate ligase
MQLRQIVQSLPALAIEGDLTQDIQGITYDSRRVKSGMMFVAIPGQHTDGHDHINNAIARGASAILCERNGFVPQRAAKIKVADSREALALASAAFYENPSTRLKMIGVTGTNGKTTVAFMVKHLLETAGIKTGLIGTIRYEVGERIIPAHRTTPEALEVQQMLAHMVRADCEACVMEVSSHALDMKRVHGIDFDVAIFTNLTQDHLDYHGTMENYYEAKKKLFTSLQSGSKRGGAIINIDDSFGRRLSRETDVEVKLTFGLSESAQLRATRIQLNQDSTQMVIESDEHHFPCTLPLIGRHNIYNALAAVGAGLCLKLGVPALKNALNTMEPVPGRLQKISQGQEFGVYVDYAHTDDALQNVLGTLRELTRGRLLLLFGCGGNRDAGKRPKMGEVAARLADFSIITSDNPRKENPGSIAAQIEEGYRSIRTDACRIQLDRRRAIEEIIQMAAPGDSVLIAGKGHETYQEFEDTVAPFDDAVYARQALEELGHTPAK